MTQVAHLFDIFSWLFKRFRPPVRLGYDDIYRSISYRFVEQPKQAGIFEYFGIPKRLHENAIDIIASFWRLTKR